MARTLLPFGAVWLATRVAYVAATVVGFELGGGLVRAGGTGGEFAFGQPTLATLLRAWAHYDAGWYLGIASAGYTNVQGTSFFPLFPLLVRGAAFLVGAGGHPVNNPDQTLNLGWVVAGLVVSNVMALATFAVVGLIALREFASAALARDAGWLMAAYPFAFFTAAPFTEATFSALCAGSLLAARGRRWPLAAGLAFLATLTRITGVILVPPLAWEFLRQHGWTPPPGRWPAATALRPVAGLVALLSAAPLAVAAYAAYLAARFGQPLAFVAGEKAWTRQLTLPWTTAELWWRHLLAQPAGGYWQLLMLTDAGLFLAFLAITLLAAGRLPAYLTLFALGLLATSIASPAVTYVDPISGTYRFLSGAFPVFIAIAFATRTRPNLRLGLIAAGFLVQSSFLTFYLTNGWLA